MAKTCRKCDGYGYRGNFSINNRVQCAACNGTGYEDCIDEKITVEEFLVQDAELIINLKNLLFKLCDAVISNDVTFKKEDEIDLEFFTEVDIALNSAKEYEGD